MAASSSVPTPPRPVPNGPRVRLFSPLSSGGLVLKGVRRAGLSDVYHYLISGSWWRLMGVFTLAYLLFNLLFGLAFWLGGGVANAHPDSFLEHFSFSVQTFATIGYGAMFPQSALAHLLVTVEAMFGILYSAVATGLVFAKFSRPKARVLFSNRAVISQRNGVPTFMFRVANERANHIVQATLSVSIIRNEVTQEGERLRRVVDLPLVRSTSPAFLLTWTAMHAIGPDSPLYGATPESLAASLVEFVITLTGQDDALGQTLHARHSYLDTEVVWNARLVDILQMEQGGRRVLDFTRFHDVEPVTPPSVEPVASSKVA